MARSVEIFVPGRICLLGEHSDWAGGYRAIDPAIEKGRAIIAGLERGIHARVAPHASALVLTSVDDKGTRRGPHEIPMDPGALLAEAQAGGFWSYIAGVAYQVSRRHLVGGLSLDNFRTDVPVKKGLSSSAAVSVLTARAFNRLYGLGLGVRDEMELAYQGEITTPSRCGRMDQGCAFGNRPVLMIFDGEELETVAIRPPRPLHFIIVDLRARKDTTRILASLNRCFPAAEGEIARGVRELLGPVNRDLVAGAFEALGFGDAPRLGSLMTEAQRAFDRLAAPACPEELTAPILHRVLAYEPLRPHIWGGKGVGSQGDGAAQLLARSAADQELAAERIERDLGMGCMGFTLGG